MGSGCKVWCIYRGGTGSDVYVLVIKEYEPGNWGYIQLVWGMYKGNLGMHEPGSDVYNWSSAIYYGAGGDFGLSVVAEERKTLL